MQSNKSESIANLALALSKLQGEVTDAHKEKSAYNYKYADLAGVLEIARPLCLKHELAVSQLCTSHADGVGVTTILMHSSGEWIESDFRMPLTSVKNGNAAQAAGSVITYARRYALAAILGITQTDNDAASELPPVKEKEINRSEKLRQDLVQAKVPAEIVKNWLMQFKATNCNELSQDSIAVLYGYLQKYRESHD